MYLVKETTPDTATYWLAAETQPSLALSRAIPYTPMPPGLQPAKHFDTIMLTEHWGEWVGPRQQCLMLAQWSPTTCQLTTQVPCFFVVLNTTALSRYASQKWYFQESRLRGISQWRFLTKLHISSGSMACSLYDTQNDLRFDTFDQTDQSSLFAPTLGYHIPRTPSVIGSIDYNNVLGDESPALPDRQSEPSQIPLLQLSEWEEGKSYDESPPTYLHYWIVWKVTLNNKVVRKNTEQDLVLAPRFYWRLFLQPKLKELVGKKFPQRRVELDDTAIVVSVNHRTQQDLILCFDQTDVQSIAKSASAPRTAFLFCGPTFETLVRNF